MSETLKRIEEKHWLDRADPPNCGECGEIAPCEVVKLARALDAACDAFDELGHPSDAKTFREALREVAGDE